MDRKTLTQANYRRIKGKLDHNVITIDTEFGYKLVYRLKPVISMDAETQYDDNLPDFVVDFIPEFISMEPNKKLTRKKLAKELRERNIIPQDLDYDRVYVGFVYSSSNDPNNHKWWLDFRNSTDESVFSFFTEKLDMTCPITTTSWYAEGIWHGRFVIRRDELDNIKMIGKDHYNIFGKLPTQCKPSKESFCNLGSAPEKSVAIRLRYNIKDNYWSADYLSKTDEILHTDSFQSIINDARMYGQLLWVGDKPKVSARISINEVSDVGIIGNTLVVRRK